MVFDFKFEVNDALASQTIREVGDVAKKALENSSEMSKNFSTQGFLTTVGNIVKPIIQNVFQPEKTSGIMPVLWGMMMNGCRQKTDSPSAANEDIFKIVKGDEKTTPENPEKPEQPTQTQE